MLAKLHPHPRDSRISFREEGHVYTIEGLEGHPISVTTLIHTLFQNFDADEVIDKMMRSRNWSTSKYHGMTKDQIKEMWNKNKEEASEAGTRMHKSIEDFMNAPESERNDAVAFFSRIGVAPPHLPQTPEFRMFMEFWTEVSRDTKFKPFRSEWLVYDADKRLSGSIDMVIEDEDGNTIILDWKRSKEIKKENRWQRGKGCMSHLQDCNYWHYSLQLNIYRHILETFYDKEVTDMFLVILHPNNKTFMLYPVERMERETAELMKLLPLDRGQPGGDEEVPHGDE